MSSGTARSLDEAEELLDSGEYAQAVELLEELARRYPRRVKILSRLAEAHRLAGDRWSYQATCERLTAADPAEPMSWLALGSAALNNTQPATAERAFAHMAARWSDHPEAPEAREMQESLREFLTAECRRRGLDDAIGFRVLLMHDEVNLQLHRGDFDKACDAAARLLAVCPTFAPALNNRSEAHFRSGRYAEAIADSRRVLQFDVTNYHALANLTRYLYLSGRFDEAETAAAALKTCAADEGEAFIKKAEAFAILGDWEAVRRSVHDGQSTWVKLSGTPGLAEHLAGVALANLGDLELARRHWRRAAAAPDAVTWADENLKDSKRPAGKRHGPWAFPLEHWVPRGVIEELIEGGVGVCQEDQVTRLVERHFERYPQLELLTDAILQRGDPAACKLLIRLAASIKRPAVFAALKKFALGERGSDELRTQALMTLSEAGYVEGQVEMWREGVLQPVGLTTQEIFWEPTVDLPPEVSDLMLAAFEAIHEGRGAEAERLLDEILRLRPEDVSAQFNRAIAVGLQGREVESLQIVRRIHRDEPDYVFARTHLADKCIADGDLENAKTLLAPISQIRRLHASEYAAWCSANINLALAMDEPQRARSLLNAWERIDPDDHRIKIWKGRIRGARGLLGRLSRLIHQPQDDA